MMSLYKKYSFFLTILSIYFITILVVLKLSTLWSIAVVTILFVVSAIFFDKYNRQKHYYKNIIDNSINIIIVSDTKRVVFANKTFFKYFKEFKNVRDFSKKHLCIGDFFEKEEGYLTSVHDGLSWIDYLIKHSDAYHKVKMKLYNQDCYFSISASILNKKNNLYSIILSDITEQERYKKELESLAVTDTLTDIGNRRFFHQKLDEQLALVQRYHYPFSLIMCDIDFFKKINDNYGHDVGDKVLVQYSSFIASILRKSDLFCRIGGDEFMVILPHTPKNKAYIAAQKMRQSVQEYKKVSPITMSFGVVEYKKGDDDVSMYQRADMALYKAKETGRNKVVLG